MKPIYLLFVLILTLEACSSDASQSAIQTAISETQIAMPTPTVASPKENPIPLPTSVPTPASLTPSPWPGYEIAVIGTGGIHFQLRFNTSIWEFNKNADGSYVSLVNKNIEMCSIDRASIGPVEGGSPNHTEENRVIGTNDFVVLIVSGNGIVRARYTFLNARFLQVGVDIGVNATGSAEECLKSAEQVIADSADLLGQYK